MKKHNEYSRQISPEVYTACPKAVLAAIAVSALTTGGDRLEDAEREILREWEILHYAGIVPQAPPKKVRYVPTSTT